MMVDPDGTLDALTILGLTSPLAEQKVGPGTQQGSSALHPGGSSGTVSRATESSGTLEAAERDPGPQKSPRPYK